MTQQAEIIITLETMRENRKHVLAIYNDLKGKFLKGYFTIADLVRDYKYSVDSAKMVMDTLARNGLLNAQMTENPNSTRYTFNNNKEKQVENMLLWKKRSEQELNFFTLAIAVVNEEIETAASDNKILWVEK